MWPPVSLEHEGADWHVKDSITPSAINSWIGEEVRPVAPKRTLAATLGEHKLRATAALMAANDTAGTLADLPRLGAARPHDAGVPPPAAAAARRRNRRISGAVHPSAARPRVTVSPIGRAIMQSSSGSRQFRSASSCSATTTAPIPKTSTPTSNGAGDTQFNHVGAGRRTRRGAELKAQAIAGRTRMGFAEAGPALGRQPFPLRLRAAHAAVRHRSAWRRGSMPSTRATAAAMSATNMMNAAGRRCSPASANGVDSPALSSCSTCRAGARIARSSALEPRQRQTQLQAELRMHW